jgi:hypothetical protein
VGTSDSKVQEAKQSLQVDWLRHKQVIGVTTTGMALHENLLRSLGAQVVICEEAAEILEVVLPPLSLSPTWLLRWCQIFGV